jgi:hypothetical protein
VLKLLVSGVLATLVGLGVATTRAPSTSYPEYCGNASTVGTFCINYDSELGRYECPPPTVPCDVVRAAMATALALQPTLGDRIGAGVAAFLLAFFAFAAGSVWLSRIRLHQSPRDIADAD